MKKSVFERLWVTEGWNIITDYELSWKVYSKEYFAIFELEENEEKSFLRIKKIFRNLRFEQKLIFLKFYNFQLKFQTLFSFLQLLQNFFLLKLLFPSLNILTFQLKTLIILQKALN